MSGQATSATCQHSEIARCEGCWAEWCRQCDPAPAALCHYCHGRGYSTAEVCPPLPMVLEPDEEVSA